MTNVILDGIFGFKNVVGYSGDYQAKMKGGKVVTDEAIRIYVAKKEPLELLRPSEIIPESLEDIPTDIEEIGRIDAGYSSLEISNRDRHRPLMSGLSVGNIEITAGTIGRLVEKRSGNMPVFAPSNAHVFVDIPDEYAPTRNEIIQPGKFDGGNIVDDTIGYWSWHDRIFPMGEESNCSVANTVMNSLNYISSKLGRRSRFTTYVVGDNHQDFAIAQLTQEATDTFILDRTYDFSLDNHAFGARLFAGSPQRTIACKAQYQLDSGYYPVDNFPVHEFKVGDRGMKSGRTTFGTEGKVTDTNGVILVNYGNFSAQFKDVIMFERMSDGGDSGSDIYYPFPHQ